MRKRRKFQQGAKDLACDNGQSDESVMELLFVYGTLRPGGRAQDMMNEFRYVGRARVRGKLYTLGWYPGLVLGEEGEVTGDVYEVPVSAFEQLDHYEGCASTSPEPHEYQRRKVDAVYKSGGTDTVWVYDFIAPVKPDALIEGGDWLEWIK